LIREEAQDEIKLQLIENFLTRLPEFEDEEIAITMEADVSLVRSIRADLKKRMIIS
jgi:transcription initiation factor IIE alpha subunit